MVHDVEIEGGFILFDLLLGDFFAVDFGEDIEVLTNEVRTDYLPVLLKHLHDILLCF